MGASAPDSVKRLVDLFDRERKVYQSPDYKEEQLRAEFLNPFFESLGWVIDIGQGLSEPWGRLGQTIVLIHDTEPTM